MTEADLIHELHILIDKEELARARDMVDYMASFMGADHPELTYAKWFIDFLDI